MAIWRNATDGSMVNLSPSRVLTIDGEAHAFGRIDQSGWPEFRISSPAIEIIEKDGITHIRTRSRIYVCARHGEILPVGASAQLREFLSAWGVPTEQWPGILSQLGRED